MRRVVVDRGARVWRDCTDLPRDLGRSPEDGIVRGLVVAGAVGVTILARYFETGVMCR
ncbi:MAG: hypothetical protein MK538_06895 [Planctomycetes bacterium]|nr:hypothetical protein [Planctomycetota bacterium]